MERWNILIRSVKQALPIVLQGQVLTQETLTTSLAIVESTLNRRPLSTPSDDPQDLTVLTPNSFLIQQASSKPQMSNVEDREINSRKRHRQSLALAGSNHQAKMDFRDKEPGGK